MNKKYTLYIVLLDPYCRCLKIDDVYAYGFIAGNNVFYYEKSIAINDQNTRSRMFIRGDKILYAGWDANTCHMLEREGYDD